MLHPFKLLLEFFKIIKPFTTFKSCQNFTKQVQTSHKTLKIPKLNKTAHKKQNITKLAKKHRKSIKY